MKLLLDLYKKYKEQISYLFFGVLTTLVNYVIYNVCTDLFNFKFGISTIIAWIISVLFAYVTNKIFVFEIKNNNILKEFISFVSFRILSLGIDYGFMYITVGKFGLNDKIMKLLSNVVVVILNYIFSKLFIFKKNDREVGK